MGEGGNVAAGGVIVFTMIAVICVFGPILVSHLEPSEGPSEGWCNHQTEMPPPNNLTCIYSEIDHKWHLNESWALMEMRK